MDKENKNLLQIGSETIIGMVHCLPLPGTPGFDGDFQKILDQAVEDAITLEKAGVDMVIVENMGDTPFASKMDMEQVVALTAAATLVKQAVKIPIGIDAAFNDCKASLSIAAAIGGTFVRVPVFVDTVVFSNGMIKPCARECMYFRKQLGVSYIKVVADIQVKHSHMLLPNITIEQSAKEAADCGADAVIVTGSSIGLETPMEMIEKAKKVVKIPVLVGSGVNYNNISEQMKIADGAIIGSSLKKDGVLTNPISYELVREVMSGLNR